VARKKTPPPALFTIGYEGRTAEDYFRLLDGAKVTLLCDVRQNPLSRKRGFSKKALAQACADRGLRYEHLPELGIASARRKNLRTPADRAALFAWYARQSLPRQTAALDRIRSWIGDDGQRVALTCFEHDAAECHRRRVAQALTRAGGPVAVDL
jgi:uncharacterized protein (DUF488 family)